MSSPSKQAKNMMKQMREDIMKLSDMSKTAKTISDYKAIEKHTKKIDAQTRALNRLNKQIQRSKTRKIQRDARKTARETRKAQREKLRASKKAARATRRVTRKKTPSPIVEIVSPGKTLDSYIVSENYKPASQKAKTPSPSQFARDITLGQGITVSPGMLAEIEKIERETRKKAASKKPSPLTMDELEELKEMENELLMEGELIGGKKMKKKKGKKHATRRYRKRR
jgi:hypothetical protein